MNPVAEDILSRLSSDDILDDELMHYGTKRHYAALTEFGPCPIHRRSFLKKFYGEK